MSMARAATSRAGERFPRAAFRRPPIPRAATARACRSWTMIAGINSTAAPKAYMPMPGSTVASCAILVNATRMPSITTSSIDHTCRCPIQRSISPAH